MRKAYPLPKGVTMLNCVLTVRDEGEKHHVHSRFSCKNLEEFKKASEIYHNFLDKAYDEITILAKESKIAFYPMFIC